MGNDYDALYQHAAELTAEENAARWPRMSPRIREVRIRALITRACVQRLEHACLNTPCHRLFLAILKAAIQDLIIGDKRLRLRSAQAYLTSPRCAVHCVHLGLEQSYLEKHLDVFCPWWRDPQYADLMGTCWNRLMVV